MEKHLTVQGKRVTASHVICAWATAAKSFVGWKQAIESDTSTLKSVITFHRKASKGAKHFDFWDFRAFMDNFVMKCSNTLITLETDGHLRPNVKDDKHICIELRNLAALTLCLCLLARKVDLCEIRTYRRTEPEWGNTKYPLGGLWLFVRRNSKKRWFWKSFIPTEPKPECPVRLFRLYLWKLHSSKSWHKAPEKDAWGQHASVWQSAVDTVSAAYHTLLHPIAESTLSSVCTALLRELGVPEEYTAKSTRSATSTYLLEVGENQDVVVSRGKWVSIAVFQQYYTQVANTTMFTDILSVCWIVNENTNTDNPKSNQHLQDLRAARDLLSQPHNREDIEDYALGSSSDDEKTHNTLWLTKEYLQLCVNRGGTTAKDHLPPLPPNHQNALQVVGGWTQSY
ncbi:MAG: hypothetical protein NMNS02_31120 [Nitrosomonas sp.]|nr:MAG: hypothetical protein NMNS02_31120 [Nitrosomonas sp.]